MQVTFSGVARATAAIKTSKQPAKKQEAIAALRALGITGEIDAFKSADSKWDYYFFDGPIPNPNPPSKLIISGVTTPPATRPVLIIPGQPTPPPAPAPRTDHLTQVRQQVAIQQDVEEMTTGYLGYPCPPGVNPRIHAQNEEIMRRHHDEAMVKTGVRNAVGYISRIEEVAQQARTNGQLLQLDPVIKRRRQKP